MAVLLIPLAFFLIFIILSRDSSNWRLNIIKAYLLIGILTVLNTEVLSTFKLLAYPAVFTFWLFIDIILLLIVIIYKNYSKVKLDTKIIRRNFALFLFLFITISILAIIAFVAPPNTGDSLTYHMSRVEHWIQGKSVAHYPTNILRQLHLNPFAEFAITQLQILSGTDRFANFVQWVSMIGSLIGVSLITDLLGGSLPIQLISAVIAITIPMGILQSTSTQNDYVLTFWLVSLVYFILCSFKAKDSRNQILHALFIGCSSGLAILTKGTAYTYALPFMVWYFWMILKKEKKLFLKTILVVTAIVLSINLGHYYRNFKLYGTPLGQTQEGPPDVKYTNDIFTPRSLASNLIKNISLHLGTPLYKLNLVMEKNIIAFHRVLGIDVNDPRTTWGGSDPNEPKFKINYISTNEDNAGNLIHLILIFISMIIILKVEKLREKNITTYLLAISMSFILFSFVFRWQIWHSRLHLPIFVLWSPFIALALSTIPNKVMKIIISILILTSFYWILFNRFKPILGSGSIFRLTRLDQYFVHDSSLETKYLEVLNLIRLNKCNNVGIYLHSNEYELWVLMHQYFPAKFRIEHVNVDNLSKKLENMPQFSNFLPCAIIYEGTNNDSTISINKQHFQKNYQNGTISLYLK